MSTRLRRAQAPGYDKFTNATWNYTFDGVLLGSITALSDLVPRHARLIAAWERAQDDQWRALWLLTPAFGWVNPPFDDAPRAAHDYVEDSVPQPVARLSVRVVSHRAAPGELLLGWQGFYTACVHKDGEHGSHLTWPHEGCIAYTERFLAGGFATQAESDEFAAQWRANYVTWKGATR